MFQPLVVGDLGVNNQNYRCLLRTLRSLRQKLFLAYLVPKLKIYF